MFDIPTFTKTCLYNFVYRHVVVVIRRSTNMASCIGLWVRIPGGSERNGWWIQNPNEASHRWEVNHVNQVIQAGNAGSAAGLNLSDLRLGSLVMCWNHDSDDLRWLRWLRWPWFTCLITSLYNLVYYFSSADPFLKQVNLKLKAAVLGDQPLQSLTCPTSSTCNLCLRQIGWNLMECCLCACLCVCHYFALFFL